MLSIRHKNTNLGELQPKIRLSPAFDSVTHECVAGSMVDKLNILKRRKALNLSQAALAKLAGSGVTQQIIDRIEKGETKTSKHQPAILAALDTEEQRREQPPTPVPAITTAGLPPERVLAALEVVMHILCKNDIAARAAAEALLSVIQAPPPPPLGADPLSVIRIETQRISERFSGKAH